MKDIERDETGRDSILTVSPEELRKARIRCSICTRRAWFNATYLIEPLGVPEPRQSWTLCKRCHKLLLLEMDRSPVLSPLRLRIAIGIVAAERSPDIYAPTHQPISDHTWIVIMAWVFGIAMLLHLVLIVVLAYISAH